MTALVFIACLVTAGECERVEIPMDNPHFCAIAGQFAISNWLAEHRGYELAGGWRCQQGRAA